MPILSAEVKSSPRPPTRHPHAGPVCVTDQELFETDGLILFRDTEQTVNPTLSRHSTLSPLSHPLHPSPYFPRHQPLLNPSSLYPPIRYPIPTQRGRVLRYERPPEGVMPPTRPDSGDVRGGGHSICSIQYQSQISNDAHRPVRVGLIVGARALSLAFVEIVSPRWIHQGPVARDRDASAHSSRNPNLHD
ncbi:hypothetical protein EVAR_39434_1 [Eumeta japonica]|uniref:Uncharacterized protein n=1 Tax=Eumeta variegata TaxID=151549 RepID=A0A4C1VYS7_EUMVA|nr:hypothetical protein EVAR_39434_1 [Eumeta japonica]